MSLKIQIYNIKYKFPTEKTNKQTNKKKDQHQKFTMLCMKNVSVLITGVFVTWVQIQEVHITTESNQ